MTNYRGFDISSFVARHVYESYFNCDYDGPTWTNNLSLDLKIIAAMPVLYPEQLKGGDRQEDGKRAAAAADARGQEEIADPTPVIRARAA
ncbi:MAG: hypothetical protein HPY67_13765 [Syntrophaceae bacterium]|nr:hypothetical protein [Syntrophaceae bacterium]